jgi:hypothetical protein
LGKSNRAADFAATTTHARKRNNAPSLVRGTELFCHLRRAEFRTREDLVQNKELQYKYDAAEDLTFSLVDSSKTSNPNKVAWQHAGVCCHVALQQRKNWVNRGGRGGGGGGMRRWGDRNAQRWDRGLPPGHEN